MSRYADAAPLLRSLGGPEAPAPFRGALNLTYRLGPSAGGVRARLAVRNRFEKGPVWNVIATLRGTLPEAEDQPILLGNHRDAWVYGAADPHSEPSRNLLGTPCLEVPIIAGVSLASLKELSISPHISPYLPTSHHISPRSRSSPSRRCPSSPAPF